MPKGDKSKYSDKQKRQTRHIDESYAERGVSEDEAERRTWATVIERIEVGKKSGSGRGKKVNEAAAAQGVKASESASKAKRRALAKTKKAAQGKLALLADHAR
jgi:plasmid stabilization system protein ParE